MSITYSEIKDQYAALQKTVDYLESRKNDFISFCKAAYADSIAFIGCGSSYYLADSAAMTARLRTGLNASHFAAGDILLNCPSYKKPLSNAIVVSISRSGSTSELLMAYQRMKEEGFKFQSVNLCCKTGSEAEKICDFSLEIPWAFDESVCQTRSVVNMYAANLLLCAYLAGDDDLANSVKTAVKQGNDYFASNEAAIKDVAEKSWTKAVILADGEMQGIAAEGALAFCEVCQLPGTYHHILDVRHGPMVLIDNQTLAVVCLSENGFNHQRKLVEDLLAKGAMVVTFSDRDIPAIPNTALNIQYPVPLDDAVRGIPFIGLLQLLSCYKAVHRNINPDLPDGLDPWIKL